MVLSFKTFQNLLTGKMAINMSEPFKTLHNFLLLHYHTFQYPLKGFERRVAKLGYGMFVQRVVSPFKTFHRSLLSDSFLTFQNPSVEQT